MQVALTCGTDLKVYQRGYHARMIVPPALFGHESAGVIERTRVGNGCDHTLTDAGWELYPIIEAMGVWGQRWAGSMRTPTPSSA